MSDDQPIPAEPTLATPEPAQASPSSEAYEPLPHEEPPAMLDIHPAQHAASTWRDFFIHIATIVLGLMIAVGPDLPGASGVRISAAGAFAGGRARHVAVHGWVGGGGTPGTEYDGKKTAGHR